MKLNIIYISALITLTPLFANAIDLGSLAKSSEELQTTAKTVASSIQTSEMIGYAAKQLNLSETTVQSSLGALLKAAQDNLSKDSFSLISKAIPDAQQYVDKAPKIDVSSVTSLFSKTTDATKKVDSANYLNAAFSKLGLSSAQVPALLNTFSGYLEKSGYGDAAAKLKQGLSFL